VGFAVVDFVSVHAFAAGKLPYPVALRPVKASAAAIASTSTFTVYVYVYVYVHVHDRKACPCPAAQMWVKIRGGGLATRRPR
jgi:hypothetical protein